MTDISITDDNRFVPPNIAHIRATSPQDGRLIANLIESFRRRGVVSRPEGILRPVADLRTMLTEAAQAARPEEFSNPSYYRPEVGALLSHRESIEGDVVENPMLTWDDEPDIVSP